MANEGLKFIGVDLTHPPNRLLPGRVAVASNVRSYAKGSITFRNLLAGALYTLGAAVHSVRRLNDSTPAGPSSGYAIINGAGTTLSMWNSTSGVVNVATGLSGNPVSIVPFRPNASVRTEAYIGDSAPQGSVTLNTQYLGLNSYGPAGTPVNFVSNGMMKVSSTGVCWKSGIKEPQLAPSVSTQDTSVPFTGNLLSTAIPWTNYTGANTDYNYGESNGFPSPSPDGTAPFLVNCTNASYITITSLTGTATVNGSLHAPSDSDPAWVVSANPGFPGQFIQIAGTGLTPSTASVVIGAFIDATGAVIAKGVAPLYFPSVVDVGAVIGVTNGIQVPSGAVALQIGINSTGNTYSSNIPPGSFSLSGEVTTNALPAVTSILGTLTAYYWGDSPDSGPVGAYFWKNSGDSGAGGPVRSISNADGSTTGNSFIFDATFNYQGSIPPPHTGPGIPGLPGIGNMNLSMQWTSLSPESVATGSSPVFSAPITTKYPNNTSYDNFNFCLVGNLYFPALGNYSFDLFSHDDVIWGIGGGVTLVSASGVYFDGSNAHVVTPTLSGNGQTITVAGGYPLLPRATEGGNSFEGGTYQHTTVTINVATAGIYPIEIDYDYWYHSGRILLLMASPTPGAPTTIIPPLPANVRQDVQYRYVYRSSATGAISNPSPESTAEAVPVTANTVTSLWSNDPQVDVVDYYRLDSVTASFTYVATGPNDNLGGGGTNTPITDSLLDTELSNKILDYDNYEPFPSIDLPQKGVCDVSGGVITWVSGGSIGGTATGFNPRWLAGTNILIGAPTSLAYTLIARPVSNTITIPGVPDGTALTYEIEEPILAAQPLPYLFGPTDNINFAFGVGDPLRPGTLYWCSGSNLDSAPDTNQMDVSDPSDPLVNGAIAGGMGVLFSISRAWVIMPNFFNAEATVTGTSGSTWSLEETSISRGLYIPRCVAVQGGGLIFFRVSDGIHVSMKGLESKSITDEDLYPLFTHEGSVPQPVTRNGVTVYPPNDALPQSQRFSVVNQFLYYDYIGTDGNPHTLVFDIEVMGWILDTYTPPATVHASDIGESVQGTLVGCNDGTVRLMSSAGTETATATVLTAAIGRRGYQHLGEMVCEYSTSSPITLKFYAADEGNGSYAPSTVTLPSTGGTLTKYWFRPSANKYKLMWMQFSSTNTFVLNILGTCCYVKDWGSSSEYKMVCPFGESGGEG